MKYLIYRQILLKLNIKYKIEFILLIFSSVIVFEVNANIDISNAVKHYKSTYSTISGKVWRDLDIDGIMDSSEPGIKDVEITLYNSLTGVQVGQNITSGSGGVYSLTISDPGQYFLKFNITNLSPRFLVTVQGGDNDISFNGQTQTLIVNAGQSINNIDAGFYIEPPEDCDEETAPECIESQILCNLNDFNSFCTSMDPPWEQVPIPGCGVGYAFHNPSWFAFVAGNENVSMIIHAAPCVSSGGSIGIQWGIYEACNLQSPVILQCPCMPTGHIPVNLYGLNVGQTYYFFIDGCAGTMCTYWVEIISEINLPDIVGPSSVKCNSTSTDCNTACTNSIITFQLEEVKNATQFEWTINNETIITEVPELTYFFDTTGIYTFEVFGFNDCSNGNKFTFPINVVNKENEDLGLKYVCSDSLSLGYVLEAWLGEPLTDTGTFIQPIVISNCTFEQKITLSLITGDTINLGKFKVCEKKLENGFAPLGWQGNPIKQPGQHFFTKSFSNNCILHQTVFIEADQLTEIHIDTFICPFDTIEIEGYKFSDEITDFIFIIPGEIDSICGKKYIINIAKGFEGCKIDICSGVGGLNFDLNFKKFKTDSIKLCCSDNPNIKGERNLEFIGQNAVFNDTLTLVDKFSCSPEIVKYWINYYINDTVLTDTFNIKIHPIPTIQIDDLPKGLCLNESPEKIEFHSICNSNSNKYQWLDYNTGIKQDTNLIFFDKSTNTGNHRLLLTAIDSFYCHSSTEIEIPVLKKKTFSVQDQSICWNEPFKIYPKFDNASIEFSNIKFQWYWKNENWPTGNSNNYEISQSDFKDFITAGEHMLCLKLISTAQNGFECSEENCIKVNIKEPIDTVIIKSGNTLISNENDALYQWLNCYAGNAMIIGENKKSFTPLTNGSYALELRKNGCIDTTKCHILIITGVLENTFGNNLKIYPNPTGGKVNLSFGEILQDFMITVKDSKSLVVQKSNYKNESEISFEINAPSGLYLLEVISGTKKILIKIIKE